MYLLVRMSVAECYLFMKFKTAQFLDVSDLIEMCRVIDIEGSFVLYKKLSSYPYMSFCYRPFILHLIDLILISFFVACY